MSIKNPTIEEANAYAAAYIRNNNKTAAFRAAFPNSKMQGDNLSKAAYKCHNTDEVCTRIAELQEAAKKRADEEFSWSAAEKRKLLRVVAAKAAGEGKFSATVAAISEDNKMVGDHAAVKTNHTIDYKNMSDEELDEELRRLIKS